MGQAEQVVSAVQGHDGHMWDMAAAKWFDKKQRLKVLFLHLSTASRPRQSAVSFFCCSKHTLPPPPPLAVKSNSEIQNLDEITTVVL